LQKKPEGYSIINIMSIAESPAAMTYDGIVGHIREHNYALVPNPLVQAELDSNRIFASFSGFLEMDQATKDKFGDYLVLPGRDKESEIGYYKTVKGQEQAGSIKKDTKEMVHWNRFAIDRFSHLRGLDPRAAQFIDNANKVYFATERVVQDIMHVMEEGAPGITGNFFRNGRYPNIFLRFLAYTNTQAQVGDTLAAFHNDKGAFTVGIAETNLGLEMGGVDKLVRPVPYHPEMALFFPGDQVKKLDSETLVRRDFPPSWHGVRQTDEPPYSSKYSRASLVAFISALDTPYATAK
jgi:hypothetical protein